MCGRFVQFADLDVLKDAFDVDVVDGDLSSGYNIAPGRDIAAVIRDGGKNVLTMLRWGLVPFWAKDKSSSYKTINARAETVKDKPTFRAAFKKRRCLILADGFYEWKKTKEGKRPFFLRPESEEPFAFAGIWEVWSGEGEERLVSCAIITTKAEGPVKEIHHRMPVILPPESYAEWLNTDVGPEIAERIIHEKHVANLKSYPVSTDVNSAKRDSPELMEPISSPNFKSA